MLYLFLSIYAFIHFNTLPPVRATLCVFEPALFFRAFSPKHPVHVVIFEGIFVLYWPEIRELLDLRLFVHVDDDIRLSRRLVRDTSAGKFQELEREHSKLSIPKYEREPCYYQGLQLTVGLYVHHR